MGLCWAFAGAGLGLGLMGLGVVWVGLVWATLPWAGLGRIPDCEQIRAADFLDQFRRLRQISSAPIVDQFCADRGSVLRSLDQFCA